MSAPSAQLWKGACLCGAVSYSVEGEPAVSVLCHCVDCQKSSGSAFQSNLFFSKGQFVVLGGSEQIQDFHDSKTDSNATLTRSFCRVCGSNLYATNPSNLSLRDVIIVMSGCLDDESRARFVPSLEYYCKRKRNWVSVGAETKELQALE